MGHPTFFILAEGLAHFFGVVADEIPFAIGSDTMVRAGDETTEFD